MAASLVVAECKKNQDQVLTARRHLPPSPLRLTCYCPSAPLHCCAELLPSGTGVHPRKIFQVLQGGWRRGVAGRLVMEESKANQAQVMMARRLLSPPPSRLTRPCSLVPPPGCVVILPSGTGGLPRKIFLTLPRGVTARQVLEGSKAILDQVRTAVRHQSPFLPRSPLRRAAHRSAGTGARRRPRARGRRPHSRRESSPLSSLPLLLCCGTRLLGWGEIPRGFPTGGRQGRGAVLGWAGHRPAKRARRAGASKTLSPLRCRCETPRLRRWGQGQRWCGGTLDWRWGVLPSRPG